MNILLMEDDLLLNEIIEEHLEEKGYKVTSTYDGNEAQEKIYSQTFDLFLFDVNVPNISGFDLLKDIRAQGIKTATIFITSANMLEDVEEGFNSGCDDYIKKPFALKELDLRIDNIKRLYNISSNHKITIEKDVVLDNLNLTILKDNKINNITKKECDVLEYLIKNKSRPISVDELCNNIWTYEDCPLSSTIRTYIKKIRKILGEEYILNIRGVGYRFNK